MDDRATGAFCTSEGCGPAEASSAQGPHQPAAAAPALSGTIEVISDAICPWCWIGKRQMERALALLAGEGLAFRVRWLPYQLNPDMPEEGVDRAAYRARKFGSLERSRALDAQVAEAGRAVGLRFCQPLIRRTPNTLRAHRVIRAAEEAGLQDAMVEALFRAYFEAGRDVGQPQELAAIAGEAGMDRQAVETLLAGDEGAARILGEDMAARRAGISGVPSFLLDRHLLFSGALPAEQMAEAFRQAHAILAARAAGQAGGTG